MNLFKKLIALSTLSAFGVVAFGSLTVNANNPVLIDPDGQFIIEEPFIPIEPIEPFPLEPIPLEPFPFDPYIDDPSIFLELESEIKDDGRVILRWNPYEHFDFFEYKILHSQEFADLKYPLNPEIQTYDLSNKTGFVDEFAPFGDNYYTVCVLTTDDRRGCSNSAYIHKQEILPDEEMRPEQEPEIERPEKDNEKPTIDEIERERLEQEKMDNQKERPGILKSLAKFISGNIVLLLTILTVVLAATGFTFAARRKKRSISKYMNQIDDTYSEYKMKAKRCEAELYRLKDIIDDELKTGKLDDSTYQLLMHRIENYMVDIQKQIVNEKFGGLPSSLKDQMFQMMEDGEITESEFDTIQKLIKRSELSVNEQDSLLETIKDFKKQDELMKKKKK